MVKKIKYKCPKCERIVKKFHHLASYADRLCSKCLDAHVRKGVISGEIYVGGKGTYSFCRKTSRKQPSGM